MLSQLLFTVFFLAGCGLAFARHPVFGLAVYVGTFYVHPPSRWWGHGWMMDVRWSYIAAALTLIAILVRRPNADARSFFKQRFVVCFLLLTFWIVLQKAWALDEDSHELLIEYYLKYVLVMFMIYRCVDSAENLRVFLWMHVLGCFYFGWIAFTEYTGGRFEDFGGPGLSEANAAAMTLVTGALAAGSLFIAGSQRARMAIVGVAPFIVNGVVTTVSRSAFLSAAVAGLVFNLLAPRAWSGRVKLLSVIAAIGFLALTTDSYWDRIETVKYQGAEVEGWDSSGGRMAVFDAQIRILKAYPMGCGHSCTEYLSPSYIPAEKLNQSTGTRASHNTFMSMFVDQGIFGAAAYVAMVVWGGLVVLRLRRHTRDSESALTSLLPAVAAIFAAITVGDMFVPYVRYEVRFWIFGLMLAMVNIAMREQQQASAVTPAATVI